MQRNTNKINRCVDQYCIGRTQILQLTDAGNHKLVLIIFIGDKQRAPQEHEDKICSTYKKK